MDIDKKFIDNVVGEKAIGETLKDVCTELSHVIPVIEAVTEMLKFSRIMGDKEGVEKYYDLGYHLLALEMMVAGPIFAAGAMGYTVPTPPERLLKSLQDLTLELQAVALGFSLSMPAWFVREEPWKNIGHKI